MNLYRLLSESRKYGNLSDIIRKINGLRLPARYFDGKGLTEFKHLTGPYYKIAVIGVDGEEVKFRFFYGNREIGILGVYTQWSVYNIEFNIRKSFPDEELAYIRDELNKRLGFHYKIGKTYKETALNNLNNTSRSKLDNLNNTSRSKLEAKGIYNSSHFVRSYKDESSVFVQYTTEKSYRSAGGGYGDHSFDAKITTIGNETQKMEGWGVVVFDEDKKMVYRSTHYDQWARNGGLIDENSGIQAPRI